MPTCKATENGEPGESQGAVEPNSPPSWYGEGVRPTEPRTPAEELAGFHLPPGFEIRLFAAEPQIAKPMNIGFDVRGRVWITDSYEYPYPASEGVTCKDSVRILEDVDRDGKADKATVFADGLNIPIGVLPYGDGCICFSIPNIYYLRDTDGDDVCDTREVILGPFDTSRDTHGMVNALRMGPDGWVYANHGFNNQSTVAGSDGHAVTMHSGNTFRFRPDGSRVELVTSGQVNPFGRTTDAWGYDYTADCHSKPISQLIRGGCYPSFGRPDDGLGFVPPMMDHLHGSTAISGLVYVNESLGISPLAGQMLSGNVMTSRINRNRVVYHGATAQAQELTDFLTSDDPWFRPVDLRLGPDGHIYVADFYNRIIGHYEVPLDHPGRDRYRGRIWQICYVGMDLQAAPFSRDEPASSSWNAVKWNVDWQSPNPVRRELALRQALSRADDRLDRQVQEAVRTGEFKSPLQRMTASSYLAQRGQLDSDVARKLALDPSAEVRAQTFRLLSDAKTAGVLQRAQLVDLAEVGLKDGNAHVRRAAVELGGRSGILTLLPKLLQQLDGAAEEDPILRQSIRIAIKELMKVDSQIAGSALASLNLSETQAAEMASIMLAVDGELAGNYLTNYLQEYAASEPRLEEMLTHMVRTLSRERVPEAIGLVRRLSKTTPEKELEFLALLTDAVDVRSVDEMPSLRDWVNEIAGKELKEAKAALESSTHLSVDWQEANGKAWPRQTRNRNGGGEVLVASSIMLGESYTGVFETSVFTPPATIEFWIVGHNGMPDQIGAGKNRVELLDAATGLVLESVLPPRSDVAQRVAWECDRYANRQVKIRCTDGDSEAAYAWIAVGGFQPVGLEPSKDSTPIASFIKLVEKYKLKNQRTALVDLSRNLSADSGSHVNAALAIARLDERKLLSVLLECVADFGLRGPAAEELLASAVGGATIETAKLGAAIVNLLSSDEQVDFANRLSTDRQLMALLLELVEQGSLSPDVLLDKGVWERLAASVDASALQRAEGLRSRAAPLDAKVDQAMVEVLESYRTLNYDSQVGAELFGKHCAACHQVAGQGQVVGPQLDGVGGRGAARLVEDLLMPDRNVDKAFRTTTLLTTSGQVLGGLVQDENARRILLVGQDGKTTEVPADEVEQRQEGLKSLMPSNFHETLSRQELAILLRFLVESAGQK